MRNRRLSLRRIAICLVALNLIAATVIFFETIADYGLSPALSAQSDNSKRFAEITTMEKIFPSKDNFAHLQQRNPFQAPQPPLKPQAPMPQAAGAPDPQFNLLAVVMTPTEKFALVRGSGSDATRLSEQEAIQGWTVSHIYADHIEIEKGGRQLRFFLQDSPSNLTADTKHAGP